LVRDRLSEFRSLSQVSPRSKDSSQSGSSVGPWRFLTNKTFNSQAQQKKDECSFMRSFFQECADIQKTIARGREAVCDLKVSVVEVARATAREQQRAAADQFTSSSQEITDCIAAVQRSLQALHTQEEHSEASQMNPGERRIRRNLQQALARKHQQLLQDFQKVQVDYRDLLRNQEARELQLLCPQAGADELLEMMEAGENRSQIVGRRMAGAHGLVLGEVQRIEEKHQDLLRLEQSCQELAQMFQEVAVLVDAQGELLDNIEENVTRAKDDTGGAVQELQVAKKVQSNTQKWTLCCLTLLVVILLAVFLPVVLKHL